MDKKCEKVLSRTKESVIKDIIEEKTTSADALKQYNLKNTTLQRQINLFKSSSNVDVATFHNVQIIHAIIILIIIIIIIINVFVSMFDSL